MASDGDTRYFVLREENGEENGVYTGGPPRQAALKAARRTTETYDEESVARENTEELRLRERGTDTVHVYQAWSWTEQPGENSPDWMEEEYTESNVTKERVEHVEE